MTTILLLVLLSNLMGVFLRGYKDGLIAANKEYPIVWLVVNFWFYCVLYNIIRIGFL